MATRPPDLSVPNTDPRERIALENYIQYLEAQLADLRIATAGLDAHVPAQPRAADAYARAIGRAHHQTLELAMAAMSLASHLSNRELAIYRRSVTKEPPIA